MGIADELITRGWCQQMYQNEDGNVCLEGAACYAVGGFVLGKPRVSDRTQFDRAVAVLDVLVGDWRGAAIFNDQPGRTFDEVLRVAKQADEILDAQ